MINSSRDLSSLLTSWLPYDNPLTLNNKFFMEFFARTKAYEFDLDIHIRLKP